MKKENPHRERVLGGGFPVGMTGLRGHVLEFL